MIRMLGKEATVLTHYDENTALLVSCDASLYDVGAVLVQQDTQG